MDTGTNDGSGLAPGRFDPSWVAQAFPPCGMRAEADELTEAVARHPAGKSDQPMSPAAQLFYDVCRRAVDGPPPRPDPEPESEAEPDAEPEPKHPDYSDPNSPWPPDDGHDRGYN